MPSEREQFQSQNKYLDYTMGTDSWGHETYKHGLIRAAWDAWQARAEIAVAIQDAAQLACNALSDVAAVGFSPAVDSKRWATQVLEPLQAALNKVK